MKEISALASLAHPLLDFSRKSASWQKFKGHILLQHLLGVTPSAQGFGGDTDELDVGLALMGLSVEEPVDSDRTGSRENQHF